MLDRLLVVESADGIEFEKSTKNAYEELKSDMMKTFVTQVATSINWTKSTRKQVTPSSTLWSSWSHNLPVILGVCKKSRIAHTIFSLKMRCNTLPSLQKQFFNLAICRGGLFNFLIEEMVLTISSHERKGAGAQYGLLWHKQSRREACLKAVH